MIITESPDNVNYVTYIDDIINYIYIYIYKSNNNKSLKIQKQEYKMYIIINTL
jgi:hypothetical protein